MGVPIFTTVEVTISHSGSILGIFIVYIEPYMVQPAIIEITLNKVLLASEEAIPAEVEPSILKDSGICIGRVHVGSSAGDKEVCDEVVEDLLDEFDGEELPD